MSYDAPVAVKVWGKYACFTRPEMKAERVSYPVMTPTAARGVLESIYWKPEFQWIVDEIWMLKDVDFVSIKRNEVSNVASERSARNWAVSGGGYVAAEDRTQRHTLALQNVAYVVRGRPVPRISGVDEAKFRDQFRRRVRTGRCFQQPFLGCREFVAFFEEPSDEDRPLNVTGSIGRMLLDFDRTGTSVKPVFFDAWLQDGVLSVPMSEA
ncbi:MAG: type I-C CRISPR-associated protein Cas5 [Thermomicrobiales bacterium]|nr:type I-C CRISPR-associated protein Cas5 [Thermomicrobiales bacterium]